MDQQFSLSWNNFHGNLSKGFAGLLGKGEFVDVTLAVEGHLLQAHKVILSICSPYFKKMFQLNPCQHPIVVLRDVTHRAMRDLLQFMYHGEVSVKREDLTSFIGTAEVLQIKGLTNKETDDVDGIDSENELPKQSNGSQKNNTDITEKSRPDHLESQCTEDVPQNSDKDLIIQQEFLEKLQRLSNLKRKSEEFLQNSFYNTDISGSEKRPKFKDKNQFTVQNINHAQGSNYDHIHHIYEDRVADITSVYPNHIASSVQVQQNNLNIVKECKDKNKLENMTNNGLQVKTECEDSDNAPVTDSNNCISPKSYDGTKDEQKNSIDYHAVQDNCSSLNSLFMDLKYLVNGKTANISRLSNQEEFSRGVMGHRLVTIPQKEDGKKKYPQRSCRLCWKLGKRRDTRFMCDTCEMPFCKNPCFEIHYNDILKTSHLHTDYFAN